MNKSIPYLVILVFVLVASCAQQSSPTGGAMDTESPKIVESSPVNFSLNYSGQSVELKFDEFVQINSLNEQLIITPSLKSQLTR